MALNQILDKPTAEEICSIFTEVVIAPDATAGAIEVFAKKKNLRLLTTGGLTNSRESRKTIRHVSGGFLCLLYTSPSPRDMRRSRMPSSA